MAVAAALLWPCRAGAATHRRACQGMGRRSSQRPHWIV